VAGTAGDDCGRSARTGDVVADRLPGRDLPSLSALLDAAAAKADGPPDAARPPHRGGIVDVRR
jgi:hypothetical protein